MNHSFVSFYFCDEDSNLIVWYRPTPLEITNDLWLGIRVVQAVSHLFNNQKFWFLLCQSLMPRHKGDLKNE